MRQFFLTTLLGLLLCMVAQAQEPTVSNITGSMIPAGAIIAREMQPIAVESYGEIPEELRSQWSSHGPYGGNIRRFAIDGTNGMNMIVACANSGAENGGVWFSEDGGITWNPSSLQNKQMWGLTAHPTQAGKFYAGGEYGLYESTDGGANWDLIAYPSTFLLGIGLQTSNPLLMVAGPSTNRGLRYSSDGGVTWNNTNVTGGFMRNFIVSPVNPSKMFVTLAGSEGGLFTSEDGAIWTPINPTNSGECNGIYADPDNVDIIILSAENGIFKTVDGGVNWSHTLSFSGYGFYGCNIVKYNNVLRTAFWYDDIYESADNGESWTIVANNIPEKSWQALAVSDAGFLAGNYGTIVREEGTDLILSVEGLSNTYVHCIAYYADRNELWAGTEGSGVWCSNDMGLTWNQKSSNLPTWWAYSFSPTSDNNRQHGRMLLATNEGTFYSDDFGDSWQSLHQTPGNNQYSGVLVHPEDSDIMWVGNDFVAYTTDGGATWNTSSGLPFAFFPSLDLCKNESGDLRLLINFQQHANTTYYSDDMGANCLETSGLGGTYFTDMSVRPAGDLPQIVYLSTDKGVYKSAHGAVYTKCPNLSGLVWSILGTTGTDVYAGSSNGVFHSANEGQNWEPFNTGIDYMTIWNLVYGNTSDVIFAGTSGHSVYAYGLEPFVGINPSHGLISTIIISPNPANDHFVITGAEAGNVRIINQSGIVLMEMPVRSNEQEINISRLPAGLYLIYVNTEKGIDIKKLVKK